MMSQIDNGSHVTLHYRLTAVLEGVEREIISTLDSRPATLQLGQGHLAAPLEKCLIGLSEGTAADFELPAGQAFGSRSPDLVQKLARKTFDAHADGESDYACGDLVEFNRPDGGRFAGVLKSQDESSVVVDFNHPLAGLPIRFSVRVIGVT